MLRRSFDGGRTCDDLQTIVSLDGWVSGNPAPVQDRDTGTIWLPFCRNLRDAPDVIRHGEALIRKGNAPRTIARTGSPSSAAMGSVGANCNRSPRAGWRCGFVASSWVVLRE